MKKYQARKNRHPNGRKEYDSAKEDDNPKANHHQKAQGSPDDTPDNRE